MSYKCVNASTIECTRGRQPGDPSGEAALAPPERGAVSPNGLTEGFYCSVVEQTPPVSLTLNHLPFQGRRGHFVPAGG